MEVMMLKRIQSALVMLVMLGLAHGCCDPPSQHFDVEEALTEELVSNFIDETILTDRAEIEFHTACYMVHREKLVGWQPDEYDACAFSLNLEPGDNPTDEVGWVKCSGTVVEYYCD